MCVDAIVVNPAKHDVCALHATVGGEPKGDVAPSGNLNLDKNFFICGRPGHMEGASCVQDSSMLELHRFQMFCWKTLHAYHRHHDQRHNPYYVMASLHPDSLTAAP